MNTRHISLAAGLLMPGLVYGQASPYRGLWVGEVRLNGVNEVSVPLDANNIPRAPTPSVTTKTFDAANLRLILHVNGAGQVSLLKQVAILNRKAGTAQSENDAALVTDERLYGSFPPQPAQRIASVVFDFGDRKATDAVDAVVNAASVQAAAVISTGQSQAAAQAAALAAAQSVIASSDAAERYAAFLRDVMNSAAVTAMSVSGNATTPQDAAAATLKTGSFYNDTRGEDLIAALEAVIAGMPAATAAEKKKAAQNVAASYADVANDYQRFIAGELMGDALSAAATAAATATAAIPRKGITAITGTANTAPVSITAAGHGLANAAKIRVTGAAIGAYNGEQTVTVVDGDHFTIPQTFIAGKAVTGYAASANLTPVTVSAPAHGLQTGTRILISGAATATYNGTFYVTRISDDAFSLPVAFAGNPATRGVWASRTGTISDFESAAGGGSAVKVTSPGHGLNNGEQIVVNGAGAAVYNGTHTVTRIDANSFTIPVPFGGNPAAKGTWIIQHEVAGYAEPAEKSTTVTSAAHGLNTGDRVTITGSGKPAYNATFEIERVSADAFIIPVTFNAADGNPDTKGAWAPAAGGTWRPLFPIYDAADSNAKIGNARAEALRIKVAAFDDTRGADAINAVLASISAAAADASGTNRDEIETLAVTAGRNALAELVARSAIPNITPTGDYTAFIRASDTRFTDYKELAPLVAAAATAGAAAEMANVLHTDDSLKNKAKERALAAASAVYATAARAQRTELPMSGDFGPGATNLTGTIILPANHPTNPFRHRRHPDHSTGFDLTRVLTLSFDGGAGDSLTASGYGVDSISGTYGEEIHGLHKPLGPDKNIGLKVSGTFLLHRISLIDALNAR